MVCCSPVLPVSKIESAFASSSASEVERTPSPVLPVSKSSSASEVERTLSPVLSLPVLYRMAKNLIYPACVMPQRELDLRENLNDQLRTFSLGTKVYKLFDSDSGISSNIELIKQLDGYTDGLSEVLSSKDGRYSYLCHKFKISTFSTMDKWKRRKMLAIYFRDRSFFAG